ncbi:MAG: PAS domain-containing protein, partial [Thermodesulfovibrio sp.]|nr:PAS domain-containing protein [Thermodesulfovibrio sp.]
MVEKNKILDWKLLLNSIFDLVAFVGTDGTIFYCNQRFAEFVNKDCDSVIGKRCHEIIHGSESFLKDCPLI